jgi:hypothetical protein
LPESNAVNAMAQKNASVASLMNTMMVFALALSDTPRTSSKVARATTMTAGMLMTPPFSPGGLAMAAGRLTPKAESRSSLTYCPQPTATAEIDTPYSSRRHQPQTHAMPSPRVA